MLLHDFVDGTGYPAVEGSGTQSVGGVPADPLHDEDLARRHLRHKRQGGIPGGIRIFIHVGHLFVTIGTANFGSFCSNVLVLKYLGSYP